MPASVTLAPGANEISRARSSQCAETDKKAHCRQANADPGSSLMRVFAAAASTATLVSGDGLIKVPRITTNGIAGLI